MNRQTVRMQSNLNENSQEIKTMGPNPTRLIPVKDWRKYHPWPPLGGLRHLIFNERSNGFEKVVRRIGRRVLIDEQAFFDWAMQHGAHK